MSLSQNLPYQGACFGMNLHITPLTLKASSNLFDLNNF